MATPPQLPETQEALLHLVYDELRRLAAGYLNNEPTAQTLQPTALVHEAWLRLGSEGKWNGPGHFFGAAAQAMRRILIDRARSKASIKHGGHLQRVLSDALDVAWETPDDSLLAVDAALTRLKETDPAAADVVMLRYYAGLSIAEIATIQDVSESTIKRTWQYARAFLHRELASEGL